MAGIHKLGVVAAVLAAVLGAPRNAHAAETPLTVMVFSGVQNLPFFAAENKGLFAKHGLKVDVKIAPNSQELRDGLAQGRYQVVHTAVDNAIAMVEQGNRDVVVIMGGDDGYNELIVQPEIARIEDLRGKKVIVDAPDTAFAFLAYKMLADKGLNRGDYVIQPVGSGAKRFEAMTSDKSNAAGMMNLPWLLLAENAGLKRLAKAVDTVGPYQATAGFTLRSWASANSDTLTQYMQAYVESLRWVLDPANKSEAVAMIVERLKISQDIAGRAYDLSADPNGGFARDARMNMPGFQNVLKLRAEVTGAWGGKPPAADAYIDLSHWERALGALGNAKP